MFGYVTVREDELKIKEYRIYKSYYCGLCHTLRERHKIRGQLTLNFDMVFLAMLLSGLYEPQTQHYEKRCPVHPTEKHLISENEMLAYTADMNILLAYHNLRDGWQDEKNLLKAAGAGLLKKEYRKVAEKYPKQAQAVVQYMEQLNLCQNENSHDLDRAAGLTGEMMRVIFTYREDEWKDSLGRIGFFLGKYIYLMDAYDDLEEDKKKKQYNVWKYYETDADFEEKTEQILNMMMAECSREFEKLPILQDVNILRNILYSGVFTKYDLRRKKRMESLSNGIQERNNKPDRRQL